MFVVDLQTADIFILFPSILPIHNFSCIMSIHSEPVNGPEAGTLAESRGDPEDTREWKEDVSKSSILQSSPMVVENLDEVGNFDSTINRLRQAELEEGAVYELKRLELERRVSKARRQAEIFEMEARIGRGGGNVVVRNSVNIHRPVPEPTVAERHIFMNFFRCD